MKVVARFDPPDAQAKYAAWRAARAELLAKIPPEAIRVDVGRAAEGGDFLRVRIAESHAGLVLAATVQAVRFFRRRWEENRGDEHSGWGASWWLLATDENGTVLQQFELYDSGPVHSYDVVHREDAYGFLTDQRLALDELASDEITRDEYEKATAELKPANRVDPLKALKTPGYSRFGSEWLRSTKPRKR